MVAHPPPHPPLRVRPMPCSTCPYVATTPSGVWAAEEYEKLLDYDRPTPDQPTALFVCHQTGLKDDDSRLCRGWVQVHREESLALRLAAVRGRVLPAEVDADTPGVQYHPTGHAAAEYGVRDIKDPGPAARAAVERIVRKRGLWGMC